MPEESPPISLDDHLDSLDDHLDELVANIVNGLGFDGPDRTELVLPSGTRIVKSSGSDYKSFTIWVGNQATILMGGACYSMLSAFTRAAATYFVADETGAKPSRYWPRARSALASTLDWYASPALTPRVQRFPISLRQNAPATAFAAYAYRFVLCHELAHIALEHRNDLAGPAPQGDVSSLGAIQNQEIDADALGLEMQIRSLRDPKQLVNALASPLYFLYLLRTFDESRLAQVNELIDYKAWQIEHSHPPYLPRILRLMDKAGSLCGDNAVKGLTMVHGDLSNIVGEIWETAWETRDEVADKAARVLTSTDDFAPAALANLLDASPIGVLQAMDANPDRSWVEGGWRFAAIVPSEFIKFLKLDPTERARLLA